jgi:hypothetical protein
MDRRLLVLAVATLAVGKSAEPAVPAMKTASPVTSMVRRGQCAVAAAITGDSPAYASA